MLEYKRYIYLVYIVILAGASVLTKNSLHDSGAVSISKIEELDQVPFQFLGVFAEETEAGKEELYRQAEQADNILVVKPTEQVNQYGYTIIQEAEIIQIIKTERILPEKIWVTRNNGFFPSEQMEDTENGKLINWGMVNIMRPEKEYLLFLNTYSNVPDFYFNEFSLGSLCLSDGEKEELIDISKTYTYGELAEMEFFTETEETLEYLKEMKTRLLAMYLP